MSGVIEWWGDLPPPMKEAIEQFRTQLGVAIDAVEFVKRALDRQVPEIDRGQRLCLMFAAVHESGYGTKQTCRSVNRMSAFGGEFNESTQHLLILADKEVREWRGMHGHGSRRNRRPSCGSAGRAVNVWRTSRGRLRGGTRAASIGSWLAMEGLLQRHAGGLW